jgi:hypothetical protein
LKGVDSFDWNGWVVLRLNQMGRPQGFPVLLIDTGINLLYNGNVNRNLYRVKGVLLYDGSKNSIE